MLPESHTTWRSTYLLGVALLLPIGTIVLVCYYFTRMNPFGPEAAANPWAFSIIALAGGLSAAMAVVLALFASVTYRARVRYEREYRQLQRFLNTDVARERARMTRNLDLFSAAQQVSMAIKQEADFERVLAVVLEQLEHFARSDSVAVFIAGDDGRAAVRAERRLGVDRFSPALTEAEVDDSLVSEALEAGRNVNSLDERTGEFVLAVYFSTPEGVRGVVRVARNAADEPDFRDEIPAYEQAVGQLVRMVSLGLKTANIWDRAIKDEKTGLYNNNHYQDQMKRQVAGARRSGKPLSLVMLDIDKFKEVNDTYGHLAGDKVLSEVAEILRREARESDTAFRYGGEELCLMCCGATEHDAALAAERLRHAIACTEFFDDRGNLMPISASFGVVEFDPSRMETERDLKELCDRALYVAKEHGRNRVVVAEGEGRFRAIETSGDPTREVKYRMGLKGDNTPLGEGSGRMRLRQGVRALADELEKAAGDDSDRARVVDSVVRETADFLTRRLSTRLSEEAEAAATETPQNPPPPSGAEPSKAEKAGTKKAARTRRRTPRQAPAASQANPPKGKRARKQPAKASPSPETTEPPAARREAPIQL
jgi:diguanylate cyclase (GGDEF)-like protein